ncbi:MAG: hypothetical protein AAFU73_22635 [Planctomycetota bacterium]
MLRSSLFTVSALALVASASAQTRQNPGAATATRINQPVKFAGTYHAATRTFTRGQAAVANFGTSDAMYAATADTPYFSAIETGEQYQDTAIIPGSTNTLVTGRDDNFVTSFDFAYCEFDPAQATTSFEIDFHESAAPCTTLVGITPTASIVVDQVPGAGQCWVVNVDLTGGEEFCIGGDGGDGFFDDDLDLDSFGWTVRYTAGGINPATGTSGFGPILGADPAATDSVYSNPNGPPVTDPMTGAPLNPPAPSSTEGTGTYYNPLSGCTSAFTPTGVAKETGSGLQNSDFWFIEDIAGAGANSGCFYFLGYFNLAAACGNGQGAPLTGNNPYSAFYMEMNGTDTCAGDGIISTPTACPTTNNTSGVPGVCTVIGDANPANNNVTLQASSLPTVPAGVFGIFLHGLSDISATPISVGQGVLCIGQSGRFQASNQIQQANANGIAEISTGAGNLDINALPIAVAPFAVAATSGTTSYFGFWHRDFVTPAASAFNFTGTAAVLWQ